MEGPKTKNYVIQLEEPEAELVDLITKSEVFSFYKDQQIKKSWMSDLFMSGIHAFTHAAIHGMENSPEANEFVDKATKLTEKCKLIILRRITASYERMLKEEDGK